MAPCFADAGQVSIQFNVPPVTFYYSERFENVSVRTHRTHRTYRTHRPQRHVQRRIHRQEGRIYYVDDRHNQVVVVPSGNRHSCCNCCDCCNCRCSGYRY